MCHNSPPATSQPLGSVFVYRPRSWQDRAQVKQKSMIELTMSPEARSASGAIELGVNMQWE